MRYNGTVGDTTIPISVEENGYERQVTLSERPFTVKWQPVSAADALPQDDPQRAFQYSLLIGERSYDIFIRALPSEEGGAASAQGYEVMLAGRPYVVTLQDERTQTLASLAGGHASGDVTIRAPMPGLVSNVMAEEGQEVQRNQTIVVLEAMKMENDLATPRAGVVKTLRASKGQTVNQGDILAIVGDLDQSGADAESDDADVQG